MKEIDVNNTKVLIRFYLVPSALQHVVDGMLNSENLLNDAAFAEIDF